MTCPFVAVAPPLWTRMWTGRDTYLFSIGKQLTQNRNDRRNIDTRSRKMMGKSVCHESCVHVSGAVKATAMEWLNSPKFSGDAWQHADVAGLCFTNLHHTHASNLCVMIGRTIYIPRDQTLQQSMI